MNMRGCRDGFTHLVVKSAGACTPAAGGSQAGVCALQDTDEAVTFCP